MHDGADIIGDDIDSKVLVKLAHVSAHILPVDGDAVITVRALLLVPQSQRVPDLVHGDAKLR